jgi:hypothetical protein
MFKMTRSYWRRQCFTYHPAIGWWHIPDLSARIPHDGNFYLLKTNSVGMRSGRNYSRRQPQDRKRILLLGDSYTAGDGVSNGERFSDLLEQRYPQLDVMNFALANTGTDQQVLIYETIARPFEADAYVLAILVENIARNGQSCRPSFDYREQSVVYRPKPYFELEDGRLILHHQPVPLEKRAENDLRDWRCDFPYLPEYPEDPYAVYRFEDGHLWCLMRAIVERFLNQVEGKPVFIMPLPVYNFFLGNLKPTYLERFKSLEDVSRKRYVLDVLPYFTRLSPADRQRCRFPNDPHYTALAHTVVAQALSDHLAKLCPELLNAGIREVS